MYFCIFYNFHRKYNIFVYSIYLSKSSSFCLVIMYCISLIVKNHDDELRTLLVLSWKSTGKRKNIGNQFRKNIFILLFFLLFPGQRIPLQASLKKIPVSRCSIPLSRLLFVVRVKTGWWWYMISLSFTLITNLYPPFPLSRNIPPSPSQSSFNSSPLFPLSDHLPP